MRLTGRLKTIAAYLSPWSRVADVGTDHAYLPIYLAKKNMYSRIIATELNSGPLQRAREEVLSLGLGQQIELRQGNGLECLEVGEVEVVVIAGMGGETIRDILANSLSIAKSLEIIILQPMSRQYLLRSWLIDNGFSLIDESLVAEENHLYQIIVVKPEGSQEKYSELELEIGPLLLKKKVNYLESHLEKILQRYHQIAKDLAEQDKAEYSLKNKEVAEKIREIKGILKWLKLKQ